MRSDTGSTAVEYSLLTALATSVVVTICWLTGQFITEASMVGTTRTSFTPDQHSPSHPDRRPIHSRPISGRFGR